MRQTYVWTAALCLLLVPRINMAQRNDLDKVSTRAQFAYTGLMGEFSSNVPLNEISTKAFRYLAKHFPGIAGETWTKNISGYTAVFWDHGTLTKLYFNPRGGFYFSLRYYLNGELKNDVRQIVTRAFPTYKIAIVTEAFDGMRTQYGINISNGEKIKMVNVRNGVIDNVKDINE